MANNNAKAPRLLVTLTALFAALCGLYLLIGGGWLVAIGGSWYYPIAGIVMLGVAGLLWRSKRSALWLYAALLLATMIWGVWEVGFDFWALTPRSDILVFFGIWLILPFVWHRLSVPSSGAVSALVVALLISGGILTWAGFNDPQEINGTLSANKRWWAVHRYSVSPTLIGVTSLVISPGSFGCFRSPVRNTHASFRLWTLSAVICFSGE